MCGSGSGSAAHADPNGDANFAVFHCGLNALKDILRGFRITRNDAAVPGEAAKIARGVAEPAARSPLSWVGLRLQALQSKGVDLGKPLESSGFGSPGYNRPVRSGVKVLNALSTSLKAGRETSQAGESIGDEIGLYPAFFHFELNCKRLGSDADGNRFALADLVFENAQGLVKRGDKEVDYPVADSAALRRWVGRDGESGSAKHVRGNQQGAAFLVEFAGVKEAAAESGFIVGAFDGAGEGKQRGVKALCADCKDKIAVTDFRLHGI